MGNQTKLLPEKEKPAILLNSEESRCLL